MRADSAPTFLEGPAGRLDALLELPRDAPRAAVVLAPPHPLHGGTLNSKVVHHAAKALLRIGCAVLRFNFRGSGLSAGTHDGGPGERADFEAAVTFLEARTPAAPIWAAGYSFGAWIAMTAGAQDPRISALIGIAPPADAYDFSPVVASGKPTFLIQGERDEICPLKATRRFYSQLTEPRELVVIDGADHVFDGQVTEVGDALEELLSDFPPTDRRPATAGNRPSIRDTTRDS